MRTSKHTSGFTLIELLVAIAIIGVLAAVLVANLVGARGRARDAAKKEGLNQMRTALRLYYNDNQEYPTAAGTRLNGANCGGTCDEGATFAVGTTVYMKGLPEYMYWQTDGGEGYHLRVALDNASDTSIVENFDRCCATPSVGGCRASSSEHVDSKLWITCSD